MSSTNPEPTALHAATCPGELAMGCSAVGPGHVLHPLQRTVTAATPSSWLDAVVGEARDGGWTALHLLDDGREVTVWHHGPLAGAARGEPVALHPTYHVLAVAGHWVNVLVKPSPSCW